MSCTPVSLKNNVNIVKINKYSNFGSYAFINEQKQFGRSIKNIIFMRFSNSKKKKQIILCIVADIRTVRTLNVDHKSSHKCSVYRPHYGRCTNVPIIFECLRYESLIVFHCEFLIFFSIFVRVDDLYF